MRIFLLGHQRCNGKYCCTNIKTQQKGGQRAMKFTVGLGFKTESNILIIKPNILPEH